VSNPYLLLAFFFELAFVDFPLVDLDPFRDVALAPFVAALHPFVVASEVVASDVVVFDPFLAPFGAASGLFGADFDLFVLSCAARITKSSCLLEHPVFSKIRLMVGEVSSSMAAREVCEALDVVALVDERETDERAACFKFEFDGGCL